MQNEQENDAGGALVGLLEHLRFVAQLQANVTNCLYHPHRKGGEHEDGPGTMVEVTPLMQEGRAAPLV